MTSRTESATIVFSVFAALFLARGQAADLPSAPVPAPAPLTGPNERGRDSVNQLQDCTSFAHVYGASLDLGDSHPLLSYDGEFRYPYLSGQFDLTQACCPNGSFIVEWDVVLKTFQAPKPFDDGRYRSLNGTLLDEIFHKTLEKRNGDIGRVYRTWDSEEEGLTWDDIQGVALTELHNKTIVGSLKAKCGLRNGTIIASLPQVGSKLTKSCLSAPGMKVIESEPIRVINSTFQDRTFADFYYDSVKLPKDARNVTELDQSGESYLRWQEDPYQDFMGLMTISGFTAANAPAFVDIADFNWTGDIAPNSNGNNSTDTDYLDLPPSNAAQGFSGIEGCYGPLMLQVFVSTKFYDAPPTPDPASYNGCFHSHKEDEETFRIVGTPASDAGSRHYTIDNLFAKNPLVCCPEGQYVESLDLTFNRDPALGADSDGGFREHLWGFGGVCSGGYLLPAITAGGGCSGNASLLLASNFTTAIEYDNIGGEYTELPYSESYISGGIVALGGVGPNASTSAGNSRLRLGQYGSPAQRVVGLDGTATCKGFASMGLVMRTRERINEPGGISAGAIAGIVVGIIAFLAIAVTAILLGVKHRQRKRSNFTHLETGLK